MFCRNCGANIGDSKFCPECGTPSGGEPPRVVETVAAVQLEPKLQRVKVCPFCAKLNQETATSCSGCKTTLAYSKVFDVDRDAAQIDKAVSIAKSREAGREEDNYKSSDVPDLSLKEIQQIYIDLDYNIFATYKAVAEQLGVDKKEAKRIVNKKMTLFKTPTRPAKPKEKTVAQERIEENKSKGVACCPKCGSTSLSANKKGFGIGKAVIGASIAPIGLIAGNINAKKLWVTCLNCGHRWKM